jgi:NAD(P)-dependent dehydrogenase (short-subunit alcohol dehydrogenase family)
MPSPLFDLTGRSIIVTGATRGLGYAIAEQLGLAGARVVVSSEVAQDVAAATASLRQAGVQAHGIPCDVADDAQLAALVQGAQAAFGGIHGLVCNAGITGRAGPMQDLQWDDYDRVMRINLRSIVALTNLALPVMADGGGGSVILMGSISALRGNGAIGAYALAKAGLAQLGRNLAVQWGPRNIRVNTIAPGLIRTAISEPLLADPAFRARRMQMTPLRRPGEPIEVAGAAVFLASPAAAFVTGHTLVVDGGTVITDGA